MTVRRRLVYHGHVQGVGFRYTTASLARRYPVTGFVRNQPDGTVELVAEGEGAAIDTFLAAVREVFAENIERADAEELSGGAPFASFEITH